MPNKQPNQSEKKPGQVANKKNKKTKSEVSDITVTSSVSHPSIQQNPEQHGVTGDASIVPGVGASASGQHKPEEHPVSGDPSVVSRGTRVSASRSSIYEADAEASSSSTALRKKRHSTKDKKKKDSKDRGKEDKGKGRKFSK